MIADIKSDAKVRMQKSITSLKEGLTKLRTGRANPDVLSEVTVSYYGSDVPISQVASISVEDALTLAIKPWEKHLTPEIEKAILNSDLGLNPASGSDVIRVPFPPLTEERRKELVKKVKAEGENSKVAIRNIRRDANTAIKALLKDGKISEDDERAAQGAIQKITDEKIADIDVVLKQKEQDLLEL